MRHDSNPSITSVPVKKLTYCRICEAHCGLEVEVDENETVLSVKPHKQHPVSKGYACIKGTGIAALHTDPDRINYPLKRVDGELHRISWEQAIAEIGQKVKTLRKEHGNRSVGMYQGNPTFFSFQNILYSAAFLESLESPNAFASHSIDGNNKYEASTQIYGRSLVHPVPDLKNTRFFMCFGSNPTVSQMSIMQVINPIEKFKAIEARGGKVVFVDPRRTETAAKVGEQVFVNPGTDVYLLLAMLHVIAHEQDLNTESVDGTCHGVEAFIANAKAWTPERVAGITNIPAAEIRRLATEYRQADGAALYMSTGVNMGPFGTLAYWLIQGLNLLTGNTDRKGGLLIPTGAFDALKLAELIGLGGFDEHFTLEGYWHRVAGCFPVSTMADEILTQHPERIRALFVSAGNPVHSVPNGKKLLTALESLDLLVSIDIYHNETNAMADYILPATDMLERSDFPVSHMVLQETPHAQYTPAMVAPKFERRPEWQIFSDLAIACGAGMFGKSLCNLLPHANKWLGKIPFTGKDKGRKAHIIQPDHLLSLMLWWGGQVSLSELKKRPEGVLLNETPPHSFIGKRVPTKDGKVQLWPERLVDDLRRLEAMAGAFTARDNALRLIGQRQRRSHNSWMHNNTFIKQPDGNIALMNPSDAKSRQIKSGDKILIKTEIGAGQTTVQLTDDVMPGVLVVPHGWGHAGSQQKRAANLAGFNVNDLIPGGQENMEPASGQAIMLGHYVSVEKVLDSKANNTESVTSSVDRDVNENNSEEVIEKVEA